MPKRKRTHRWREEVNPSQKPGLKKEEVEKKLVHGRKVLNRALKTARGFERQKLSKRIKLATKEQDGQEIGRLHRELDILKTLDLSVAVESHLYKTLLKSKNIQESGMLPDCVKAGPKWNELSPEELAAVSNVTARLYNTKPVKEAMSRIIGSIYAIFGIRSPSITTESNNIERGTPRLKIKDRARPSEHDIDEDVDGQDIQSSDTYPRLLEVSTDCATLDPDTNYRSDLESDDAHESDDMHDRLSGTYSDEESNGDVDKISKTRELNSFLGAPEQQDDVSSVVSQPSQSLSPPLMPQKSTKKAQQSSSKPGSTFLPTLMGGYWSGSESATDEEDTLTPKKNRPGQQARRALWEKKFGAKANHLKGQPSGKSRDKDWDPRRGARSAEESRFMRSRAASRGSKAFTQTRGQSSGENAVAVKPRARGMGKQDDAGPLHPSWEAAKKAKDTHKTASFQGKKVVFE